MARDLQRTIFHLVEDNLGFLTTGMAKEADIPIEELARLARRGTLDRISQGVYRLYEFPPNPLDSYMAASLWPRGVPGTLSHETALDLYEVCDINPAKVHVSVPIGHRIRRAVPLLYVIHHDAIPESDIGYIEAIRITKLRRAIIDCIAWGIGTYLLDQAVESGRKQGLLTSGEQADLMHRLEVRGSAVDASL